MESNTPNHEKLDVSKLLDEESIIESSNNYSLPCLDSAIIETLPSIFREGMMRYEDNNQKDVFAFSLMTLLSSTLRNVFVIHNKEKYGLNLYLFICASAGSGKSVMTHPLHLVKSIETYLDKVYKERMEDYEFTCAKAEEDGVDKPTDPPVREELFIPGNSSLASFIEDLDNNFGRGLIYETEADTIANTLKQDWGGYSEILRMAFHHESIKNKRKGGKLINIESPYISLCISGTPQQFTRLIPNAENGLLSRLLVYNFTGKVEWDNNVFDPTGWKELNKKNDKLGDELLKLYLYLEKREQVVYTWHVEHQKKLNAFFDMKLKSYHKIYGNDSNAIVKRLGLIASRIANIFRVTTIFEESEELPDTIESNDNDLEITLHFISLFIKHSFNMFEKLPKEESAEQSTKKGNMMRLFELLPSKISRSEAIELGVSHSFKKRTIDDYLSKLKQHGLLEKTPDGCYVKSKPED